MNSNTNFGIGLLLGVSFLVSTVIACAETPVSLTPVDTEVPVPTVRSLPSPPPTPVETEVAAPIKRPPPPPTPTLEERRVQTPIDWPCKT